MSQLTWSQFVIKVKQGKTLSVDLLAYQVVFSFVLAYILHLDVSNTVYIASLSMVLISSFVMADLTAHTYWNGWVSDLTLGQFLRHKLITRTHDIDGELIILVQIGIIMYSIHGHMIFISGPETILTVFVAIQIITVLVAITDMIIHRFYH